MNYLDSDILGIVVAMITVAFSIYSSITSRKKKGNRTPENVQSAQVYEQEENPAVLESDEIDEFFDLLLSGNAEKEEASDMVGETMEEPSPAEENVRPEEQEGISLTIWPDRISAVIEKQPQLEDEVGDAQDLKKRIKLDPKDIVICSEILNPKFKEF